MREAKKAVCGSCVFALIYFRKTWRRGLAAAGMLRQRSPLVLVFKYQRSCSYHKSSTRLELKTVFREPKFRTLGVYTTMQADIHSPRAYTRHNRPPPAPKTPRSAPVGEIFIPARGSVVIAAWYKSAPNETRRPRSLLGPTVFYLPPGGDPPWATPGPIWPRGAGSGGAG